MTVLIVIVHVVVCLALIMIVLLQTGKGADMGAVFGGAGSQTLFGSTGATTFLGKLTTGAAIIFMITSLTLAYISKSTEKSIISDIKTTAPPSSESVPAPVVPAPDAEPAATPAASEGAASDDVSDMMDTPDAPETQSAAPPLVAETVDAADEAEAEQ